MRISDWSSDVCSSDLLDAAEHCVAEKRTVLTRDVRNALRARGQDPTLPEMRRVRLLEMADAMDMFCQGTDGEMFDRDGTPWPEADITLVDLATYRSEERRVGKEWVSTCRYRWSTKHKKKKEKTHKGSTTHTT